MSNDQIGAPQGRGQSIVVALISSALLALWIGWGAGWIWALAGVFGIAVHETGHMLAINRAGLGPSRIHFVPFFGGLATQPRPAPNEITGVMIALAGPAFGMLAILPFFALNYITGDGRWAQGAFFIAIINLLNLFPAPPLDGSKALGPALAKVHPQFERVVAIALGALAVIWAVTASEWVIALVIAVTILPLMGGRPLRAPATPLTGEETLMAVSLYVCTIGLCLVAISAVGRALNLENSFDLLQGILR